MDSKKRSTPIGYLRDGETFIALTHAAAPSNWYQNALCSGQALLEIKGKPLDARVEAVNDQAERERIFDRYKRARARNFTCYFDIPIDAPEAALKQALATRAFVRMMPRE